MSSEMEWRAHLQRLPWNDISFEWHQKIDSTQTRAHVLLNHDFQQGSLVVAQEQAAGRGRDGRKWLSQSGAGLYMSMNWRFGQLVYGVHVLPLIVSCAISEVIRAIEGFALPAHVKWPNDLYVGSRKIGGVLIDARTHSTVQDSVSDAHKTIDTVIGIGISLSQDRSDFPEAWRDQVTSWRLECEKSPSPARIGSAIYAAVRMALERLERLPSSEFKHILAWINDYICWNDLFLPYRYQDRLIYARAIEMNESFHLCIESEDGELIWLK